MRSWAGAVRGRARRARATGRTRRGRRGLRRAVTIGAETWPEVIAGGRGEGSPAGQAGAPGGARPGGGGPLAFRADGGQGGDHPRDDVGLEEDEDADQGG